MATLEKVQAQIAKLQARADELISRKSSSVIATICDLMDKHGLTTSDIDAHQGGKKRGRPAGVKALATPKTSVAKYRDPKTGATWTGHGRAPAWIAPAKDRSRFLADAVGSDAPVAVSEEKRTGNYPRGPQPAKYRDPKSGATWSGRGRAPAWLAGVKDLSSFLIAEPSGKTTSNAVVASKKSSARKAVKAATKKVPAKKSVVAKKAVAKKSAAKTLAKAAPAATKPAAKQATANRVAKKVSRKAPAKVGVKNTAAGAESMVAKPVMSSGETAAAYA